MSPTTVPAYHRGTIDMNSVPGKNEFVVTLPAAPASNRLGCLRSSL
jgi:nitrogen-specific signal transduction histidine kinase